MFIKATNPPCAGSTCTFALTLVRIPDVPDMAGKLISQPLSRLALIDTEAEEEAAVETEAEREGEMETDPLLSQSEVLPFCESFLPTPLLCIIARLSTCGIRSLVLSLNSLLGNPSTIGLLIARGENIRENIVR